MSRRWPWGRGGRSREGALDVVPIRRRHLRAIIAIEQQVYPRPWTQGVFVSELDQARLGRRRYVVAMRGRQLVGYGGIMFTDDRLSDGEAHITNVAVDPAAQRTGVGRAVMLDLVREARRRGCTSMSLEVRAGNYPALALYGQLGFAPAGVRKKYYENTDDAIVMWCHDVDADHYAERLDRVEAQHGA